MRYSSIKSTVAVLLISVSVLAAAPIATARQTQKSQGARTREAAPSSDRFAGVRDLINRTLRRLGINGGITIPTPRNDEDEVTQSTPTNPNSMNDPA